MLSSVMLFFLIDFLSTITNCITNCDSKRSKETDIVKKKSDIIAITKFKRVGSNWGK